VSILTRSDVERTVSRFGRALSVAQRRVTALSRAGWQSDALALREAVIAAQVAYKNDLRHLSMRDALPLLNGICERLERALADAQVGSVRNACDVPSAYVCWENWKWWAMPPPLPLSQVNVWDGGV
jgi:hypothetical protein